MAMQAVLIDFFNYFNALTESRRANPLDDVASVIANAQIDGEPDLARSTRSPTT